MDLIEFLVRENKIKKEEAKKAREEIKKTGKETEEVILDKNILKESDLFKAKSKFLETPIREIKEEKFIPEALSFIPKESVQFYKMLPLSVDKDKGEMDIGMVYPEDARAREALNFLARQQKLAPNVFLITLSDFKDFFEKYHTPEKEMEKALEKLEEDVKTETPVQAKGAQGLERLVEDAPIVKMTGVILREAVEGKASDIHIEPAKSNLRIRYRVDGVLYPSLFLPLKVHRGIVARIKILSNLKIDETRKPQDGRFSATIKGTKIDFRVSTFPTNFGEKVVLRVLNPEEGMKTLKELGLRWKNLTALENASKKPFGMILATGPTGSGKTTTLYSVLRLLNTEGVNIVTLEDPVEYLIGGVSQSQIRPDIGYTFATGLRQILRQDPDIIMVGEIRDQETASLAVHAALTGHLVLSTIHTTSAVGVVPRLVDMGVEQFLVSSTLSLAISQRLVRVLCEECKQKTELKEKEREYIKKRIDNLPANVRKNVNLDEIKYIYKPKGCKKCNLKGYSGRLGVYESVEMTSEMSNVITNSLSESAIFKEAREQGMITMEEDGIVKVLEGKTSLEEVMRIAKE